MAGGIDWFRWHHGSVTDPKFQLVARKAQARFGDVMTVWAFILEAASANAQRGRTGDLDAEAIDCLLGAEEGTTQRILSAMRDRGLYDGDAIPAWDKRQPKREDETAAERKRKQRERDHELAVAGAVTGNVSRNVTQGHDREEKSREEKKEDYGAKAPASSAGAGVTLPADFVPTPAAKVCLALKGCGIWPVNPQDQRLLTLLAAGAVEGEFTGFAAKALEAAPGKAFAYLLGCVEGERTRAAQTSGKLHRGAMPNKQQAIEQRNRAVGSEWLAQEGAT
jgi:hypothetical protein